MNVLLTIVEERWADVETMPDYGQIANFRQYGNNLLQVYQQYCHVKGQSGYEFLNLLLEYDPKKRASAEEALQHQYFRDDPRPGHK